MTNYVITRDLETNKVKRIHQYDDDKTDKDTIRRAIKSNELKNKENGDIFILIEDPLFEDVLIHVFEQQIIDNDFEGALRRTLKDPVERAIIELQDLLHDINFNMEDK